MDSKTIVFGMLIAAAIATAACTGTEQPSQTTTTPAPVPTPAVPLPPAELKQIQQKSVGDYTVAIMNETGSLKMGANSLTLEFRRGDQVADPGEVQVKPMMEMKGMGPMVATSNVTPAGIPGRYNVTTDLSMAGQWKLMVTFKGGETQFDLNAQ